MCLWLITACLGVLPANPAPPNVIVVGLPTPILQPITVATAATVVTVTAATTAATTAAVTAAPTTTTTPKPPGNTTPAPPPPVTNPPTTAPPPTTTAAPATTVPPPPPTTQPPPPPTTQPPPPATTGAPTTNTPVTATPPPATTAPAATNPAPTAGGPNIILICNDPTQVCVANPEQPVTGISIDPRQGTPPPSALPLVAYSAQDSAVKFPREKRSVRLLMRGATNGTRAGGRQRRQAGCTCVPTGTCPTNTNYGAGMIDFRIVTPGNSGPCPQGQVYCCTTPTPAPAPTVACGTRQAVPATAAAGPGQAGFGEYPWMAIIITNTNDYVAGGVLIDQYNVLTVIHRISAYIVAGTTPNLKVRLGEWDASATYEPIPFKEYTIRRVFQHPSFNSATLQYDLAVLRLSTPVPFTPAAGSVPSINRACLPASSATSFTGQRCYVTGWGKNAFNQGVYQQILKEVDVPVVDSNSCQNQLRAARLGASFVLDTNTFICAGGEMNKDSCTGDGGSGLVCQVNGQWTVAGLVAWGLGCAAATVPGVYVSVPALLPWIQQQQATAA
ncbi:hypothetical protein JYU34_003456 [Plutella xylostella]|uniref:Peptidase S1 domain-containing protein n=1 Tax=Plutella xylostella TaxID=51655 RepID=A0ABQ7R034_PLUXY|nr:hypothetical protein JYU34_003456 [Plutella xylostella]